MGKLTRIVTGVIEAWHSHVWARSATVPKISKGELIKVMIGLTELMRMGDTIWYLFGESKVRKDLQCSSKEFETASGLYPRN
jgi:hypothetical protein